MLEGTRYLSSTKVRNKGLSHQSSGIVLYYPVFSCFLPTEQKEQISMIKQLGCPTLCLTLSAVRNKWTELLRILKGILDDVNLSTDASLELQCNGRAQLIRIDPVTCVF